MVHSNGIYTVKPFARKSNTVCSIHTWASAPIRITFWACWARTKASTSATHAEKRVFSTIGASARCCLISARVLPKPLGYCSVSKKGMLSAYKPCNNTLLRATKASASCNTGVKRSCMSITMQTVLSV